MQYGARGKTTPNGGRRVSVNRIVCDCTNALTVLQCSLEVVACYLLVMLTSAGVSVLSFFPPVFHVPYPALT